MSLNLDSESFVNIYIDTALEVVSVNDPPTLDDFYKYIFERVSERTGLSEKGIKYVHHAFHWALFLRDYSPLEIVHPQGINGLSRVGMKSNPLEKSELVCHLLREYRTWLDARLKNLKQL